MFGTLRYDPQRNGSEFTERPNGSLLGDAGAHVPQHSACDKCRFKKLRCSGQKSGCDRCRATATSCVYSETVDGKGTRRRKRPDTRLQEKGLSSQSGAAPPTQLGSTNVFAPQSTEAAVGQQIGTPPRQENNPFQHEQGRDPAEDDMLGGLGSPVPSFEEDCIISDQMLRDIMPDYGSHGVGNYNTTTPDYTFHTDSNANDSFPFGSPILDSNSASSDHTQGRPTLSTKAILTPMTRPHSVLPSPSSTAYPMAHADKLHLQQPTHRDNVGICTPPLTYGNRAAQITQNAESMIPSSYHAHSSCQCLQTLVLLLEETEYRSNAIDSAILDSALAYHKEALHRCNTMLRCLICTARSENMMLLAVVCEKLVAMCDRIASRFLQHTWQPHVCFGSKHGIEERSSRKGDECRRKVFFGNYEIDQREEWEHLIRVLIFLQLKRLGSLMAKIKMVTSLELRGAQHTVLLTAERKIRDTAAKLQRTEVQGRMGSTDPS
ncbi:MAG: hypothetical protein Q9187_000392 [Circinaria calcarea]